MLIKCQCTSFTVYLQLYCVCLCKWRTVIENNLYFSNLLIFLRTTLWYWVLHLSAISFINYDTRIPCHVHVHILFSIILHWNTLTPNTMSLFLIFSFFHWQAHTVSTQSLTDTDCPPALRHSHSLSFSRFLSLSHTHTLSLLLTLFLSLSLSLSLYYFSCRRWRFCSSDWRSKLRSNMGLTLWSHPGKWNKM